jgi:ferredoxin
MKYIHIAHKKPECIGCALCAEVAPDYWRMDDHGEAQLIQVIRQDRQFEYAHGYEDDRPVLEQAASGCPVGIIRIRPD